MKISLKARNVLKLSVVWLLNVTVFSGVVTDIPDFRDADALKVLSLELAKATSAGWLYPCFLTLVSIFNGVVPRLTKECLVFWPNPRPGSRAFSHFMLGDSAIDRKALREHFGPLPSEPDEQNALWVKWLHEFEDDTRVRQKYGLYLFARDWTTIAVATLVLGSLIAPWFAQDVVGTLWYSAALLCQSLFARRLARVQGEQLVMSVMSCKGSTVSTRSDGNLSER